MAEFITEEKIAEMGSKLEKLGEVRGTIMEYQAGSMADVERLTREAVEDSRNTLLHLAGEKGADYVLSDILQLWQQG